MKKAVVLGGAGFLGRRLVALIAQGTHGHPGWPEFDAVHVLDKMEFVENDFIRDARKQSGILLTSGLGDISSPKQLTEALQGAHTVFHLASVVHVGLDRNPVIDEVNIEGTRNVISTCLDLKVPYLVYTSSEDVVVNGKSISNGDESLPYPDTFIHDYVRTKVEGEKLVLAANGQQGLRTCSVRPVHIYGPEDPHAIVVSLETFARGSVPFLLGDGKARFDVVYVDNVAHAHLLAASGLHDKSTAQSIAGEAFFIGEKNRPNYFDWLRPYAESKGVNMPTRRLPDSAVFLLARAMEVIHRLTGREVPFHRFHYYLLCRDLYFSNAKASRLLGYKPLVDPGEGQRRTLDWLAGVDLSV